MPTSALHSTSQIRSFVLSITKTSGFGYYSEFWTTADRGERNTGANSMSGIHNHDSEDLEQGLSVPTLLLSPAHGSIDSGSSYAVVILTCMDVTVFPRERSASTFSQKKINVGSGESPIARAKLYQSLRYGTRCKSVE